MSKIDYLTNDRLLPFTFTYEYFSEVGSTYSGTLLATLGYLILTDLKKIKIILFSDFFNVYVNIYEIPTCVRI